MACSQKPDLILMDILMPKVDGLAACYAIKTNEATKATPVAMLTGLDYELNRKLSREVMGADEYLTKPFSLQELLDTVGRLLKLNSKQASIRITTTRSTRTPSWKTAPNLLTSADFTMRLLKDC